MVQWHVAGIYFYGICWKWNEGFERALKTWRGKNIAPGL